MSELSALLLGLGLGIRHATDADHVVVVSTLLQREPGARRAAQIAAWWGAGHSASFLGLGVLILLFGVRLPASAERGAELLVALMLLGFGLWHLWSARRGVAPVPTSSAPFSATRTRSVLVGVVHGLAGSAGIALLASATLSSRSLALAYLLLFGAGTVLGMVLLTLLLSWPLSWTQRQEGRAAQVAVLGAALLSLGLGAWILWEVAAPNA
jgi:high-affinity nickel permease